MKKIGIIAGSIGLVALVGTAVVLPVAITSSNAANELAIKQKTIDEIASTAQLQDDFIDIFEYSAAESGNKTIQDLINEKSNEWINWINPINKKNEITKSAIASIESVTIIFLDPDVKPPPLIGSRLEFKIVWKEGIIVPQDWKNDYNLDFGLDVKNSQLPWKDDSIIAIAFQEMINAGGTQGIYNSIEEVALELNNAKHNKQLLI